MRLSAAAGKLPPGAGLDGGFSMRRDQGDLWQVKNQRWGLLW